MKKSTLIRAAVGIVALTGMVDGALAQVKMPKVTEADFVTSNLQIVLDGKKQVGILSREFVVVDGVGKQQDLLYLPTAEYTIDWSKGYSLQSNEVFTLDAEKKLVSKTLDPTAWQGALYITAKGEYSYAPIADAKDATLKPYMIEDKRGEEVEQYAIVKVGAQVWMRENLRTALATDGTPLLTGLSKDKWQDLKKEPAVCYYNNEEASRTKQGGLYNWHAVVGERGLAPKGWLVPSVAHWEDLMKYLDPKGAMTYDDEVASLSAEGGALIKSVDLWKSPPAGGGKQVLSGTNASMLDLKPFGSTSTSKYFDGYSGLGHQAYFWTTNQSEMEEKKAMFIRLFWDSNTVNCYFDDKFYGYSVRCLAEEPLTLEKPDPDEDEAIESIAGSDSAGFKVMQQGNEIDLWVRADLLGSSLEVYDMMGRRVLVQRIDQSDVRLGINTLAGGLYIIKVDRYQAKVRID